MLIHISQRLVVQFGSETNMYALNARSLLLLILTISVTHAARLSHKAIREIRHDVLAYRSNVDSKSRQGPKNYLYALTKP